MIQLNGKYSTAIIHHNTADDASVSQIMQMLNSPAITNTVHIMPDFHSGKGSVVGFTMLASDVVIPNVVGVDIGCGMLSCLILDNGLSKDEMDKRIRAAVPLGFSVNSTPQYSKFDNIERFVVLADAVGMGRDRMELSIGTLGGGNHFIELGRGPNGGLFVTVHSGSRNFGKVVAEFYQRQAIEYSRTKAGVQKNLEFMPTDLYIDGMEIAQRYANLNRKVIMRRIVEALDSSVLSVTQCQHNYISAEDRIIRKGAVSAALGADIILPFNRAEGIWIMKGLGNRDWNCSAPHGAGRTMSRGEAKRRLTQESVDTEMEDSGVFSSFNPVDEAPAAYKNPAEIQELVKETAEFCYAIKPILNIKG